jgi:hypothetical protein
MSRRASRFAKGGDAVNKFTKTIPAWVKSPQGAWRDALIYIETGDRAVLKRIRPDPDPNVFWTHDIAAAMADPGSMGDEDRRALHAMAEFEAYDQIGKWLSNALGRAKGDEGLHDIVRQELATVQAPGVRISAMTVAHIPNLARGGRPNSAGRHLLSLSDTDLLVAVKRVGRLCCESDRDTSFPNLAQFLLDFAPERLGPLIPAMEMTPRLCEVILRKGADRYERAVAAAWRALKGPAQRFEIGRILTRHAPVWYARETLGVARVLLADEIWPTAGGDSGIWMVQTFGAEVLDEIIAYLGRTAKSEGWWEQAPWSRVTSAAVQALGARAIPAVLAALRTKDMKVHLEVLSHLVALDDGTHAALIEAELRRRLAESGEFTRSGDRKRGPHDLVSTIALAARWKPAVLADQLWGLLGHRSRFVREAAGRALGRLGAEVISRAAAMLADRKADARAGAVAVLGTAGTPEALRALEDRLDDEPADDIRDAIVLALDAARAAEGRAVSREEIDRRIARTVPKLKGPAAAWLDEPRLPALRYRDGRPLGPDATRYLIYRQARAREIRADVEARPLLERIDRGTSGAFALEVLRQFAASKADARDRWALALAGLLGDDRIVPPLNQLIPAWAESSRGQMAEYAVQALALLGSDAALMCVDATATRYRARNKNVGAAAAEAFAAVAERLGLTIDQLGDRVVPRLGFEPGRPRIIDGGGKRIEVTIGPDFKLKYRDLEEGKAIASLPKSLPKEVLTEFKEMGATLREVAKAQKLRLENLMVRQHRWPVARWRGLFLDHPVLFGPFATRLAWGHYDVSGALTGTFRALEDRTLTDAADEAFELPEGGSVGIVHPLELDDEVLAAWRTHLADYEVAPPFPQLDRPVIRASDEQRDVRMSRELAGTGLNALTFRGRAEKLGWARGSVTDGGGIDFYRKVFPGAGVEAFIGLDGMFVITGMDESVDLGEFYFVKEGSVSVGSYTDDNPSDASDARLIAFGAVPPVVFSEVMGDLKRIAGKAVDGAPEEA